MIMLERVLLIDVILTRLQHVLDHLHYNHEELMIKDTQSHVDEDNAFIT